MNPLSGFDFSILDDPEFREDAVREDIIAPILKELGYAAWSTAPTIAKLGHKAESIAMSRLQPSKSGGSRKGTN